MVKFAGKYTRTQEEKYDEFLAKLGLNYLMRKGATVSTPLMEISETAPGKWKMVTSTKPVSYTHLTLPTTPYV